jgi:hypothetical protein
MINFIGFIYFQRIRLSKVRLNGELIVTRMSAEAFEH